MWDQFTSWLVANHVGDLASVAGFALSIVGFAFTLVSVRSSKQAAIRAERAARQAVSQMRMFEEVVDFSAAISALDEIRRFHRLRQWAILPDRYASLRRTLITIKTASTGLREDQLAKVQDALATLRSIERAVERKVSEPDKLDAARFNNVLAGPIDNLQSMLTELKMSQAEHDRKAS